MDFIEKYEKWLNYSHLPEELREELESIAGKTDEIEERFFKDLEFGTGGLRGIIGAGTNRMNIYTVRKATLGLAHYLKKVSQDNSVVIAYDSRYKSREFALEAALVLAKNKIKAYVFQKITPTPVLSFAIRYLEATAGIVITASHNPKEYNGYKVYNCHGGQITDKMALAITEEINQVEDELKVSVLAQKEAEEKDLLVWLDEEVLTAYLAKTKGLVMRPDIIEGNSFDLQIVYTPLHGTGYIPVSRLFKETGFKNVHIVEEQAKPDPDFSTVKYPNPEEHAAFRLALNQAEKVQADIVLATDPDADRLGVAVRDEKGKYVILTGNQLGALMIDYILQMRKYKGNLPINGVV
ncbi:MAG: phospho-sugar mutase, partial [Clostridia bacterium]|nr:phospho-sugar mutase [Clostridia bacterium]